MGRVIDEIYERHVAAPRRALRTEHARRLYDQEWWAEAAKTRAEALKDASWSPDAFLVVTLMDKILGTVPGNEGDRDGDRQANP